MFLFVTRTQDLVFTAFLHVMQWVNRDLRSVRGTVRGAAGRWPLFDPVSDSPSPLYWFPFMDFHSFLEVFEGVVSTPASWQHPNTGRYSHTVC